LCIIDAAAAAAGAEAAPYQLELLDSCCSAAALIEKSLQAVAPRRAATLATHASAACVVSHYSRL